MFHRSYKTAVKKFPRENWYEELNQKNFKVRPNFERVSRVSWAIVYVIDLNIIFCGHPPHTHILKSKYQRKQVPEKF